MSHEEKSNTERPAGKVTITRTAMSDNAVAISSRVTAAHRGTDHVPHGVEVEIHETGMTGRAKATDSQVTASESRDLRIGGEKSSVDQEKETGTSENRNLHFGHSDTAAILLAGAGTSANIFMQDVTRMKSLLISESVDISVNKITEVIQRGKSTKTAIQQAIEDVTEELKSTKNGHFIFYYSGHFNKQNQFKVDNKGKEDLDYYFDKDLAEDLMEIPAKYVLFILDCCRAGAAKVGAKDDDDDDDDDGLAQGGEEAPLPRLWEFFNKSIQAKGKEEGPTPVAEKIVQWASALPVERSFDHLPTQSSFFTNAIINVITHPDSREKIRKELGDGQTHATVLHLHEHVTDHVKRALEKYRKMQRPVINPPHADEEYFKAFPAFAKML